jgi:hypothetical protein
MDKFRYKFKLRDPEMCYNPPKCTFSYYQICSMKNPLTNKYPVRKFIFNEKNEIINTLVKEYPKSRLEKFLEITPENKIRLFPTYDVSMIAYPNTDEILNAHSELLR